MSEKVVPEDSSYKGGDFEERRDGSERLGEPINNNRIGVAALRLW